MSKPFPENAGFASTAASETAAAMMDETGKRIKQRDLISGALLAAGRDGLIGEEVRQLLIEHGVKGAQLGQASARLSELSTPSKGEIAPAVATDRQRVSKTSLMGQTIYVHRKFADAADLASKANNKAPRQKKPELQNQAVHDLAAQMSRIVNAKPDSSGFVRVEITPMELQLLKKTQAEAGLL